MIVKDFQVSYINMSLADLKRTLTSHLGRFGCVPGLHYFSLENRLDAQSGTCAPRLTRTPSQSETTLKEGDSTKQAPTRPLSFYLRSPRKQNHIRWGHAGIWRLRLDFRGFVVINPSWSLFISLQPMFATTQHLKARCARRNRLCWMEMPGC